MKTGRFVTHPVLSHPRSRFVFFIFLLMSFVLGGVCWVRLSEALTQTGIHPGDLNDEHPFVVMLLSPWFRAGIVFAAALIASALAAHKSVGPIQRLEIWLDRQEKGERSGFRVRNDDKFHYLVLLIHRLLKHV